MKRVYEKNSILGHGRPLTVADLDEVERAIGIALPPSLRAHYARYNGGTPERATFIAASGDDFDFGPFSTMRWRQHPHQVLFEETYRRIVLQEALVPAWLVPFAIDGGGNFFCMDRGDEAIHYVPMDVPGEPDAGERIAESLVALVEGMVDGL